MVDVTTARITSFTVPPQLVRTFLISRSGILPHATCCGPLQTVMNTNDNGSPIMFQATHEGEIPQGPVAIHHLAQNLSGNRLQLGTSAPLQVHLPHVITNLEAGVKFPCGQADVERSCDNTLP